MGRTADKYVAFFFFKFHNTWSQKHPKYSAVIQSLLNCFLCFGEVLRGGRIIELRLYISVYISFCYFQHCFLLHLKTVLLPVQWTRLGKEFKIWHIVLRLCPVPSYSAFWLCQLSYSIESYHVTLYLILLYHGVL